MKRTILNAATLAVIAALLCATCTEKGIDTDSGRWAGDVDRLLLMAAPAKYAVTVSSAGAGASGAGSYAEGARVAVSAGAEPNGRPFEKWTTASAGVTFADANSAATSFIMPPNAVTVTANFKTPPATSATYAVVVTGGEGATGSGEYAAGVTVTINAGTPPEGKKFKDWTPTGNGVSLAGVNDAMTTFKMPANAVTVTASFETSFEKGGTLTDGRDKQAYATVKIGTMTWMAKNLNYRTTSGEGDSWCYDDEESYCDTYGRLYNWAAAQVVCPTGWHLPTYDEWARLMEFADMKRDYSNGLWSGNANKLMATSWGNGTDDFGFSALPGGWRTATGEFGMDWLVVGYTGIWWVYREYQAFWLRDLDSFGWFNPGDSHEAWNDKRTAYSVRCMMDE